MSCPDLSALASDHNQLPFAISIPLVNDTPIGLKLDLYSVLRLRIPPLVTERLDST